MQLGAIISGGAHGALIVVAMLGGLDWWQENLPEPKITRVTLVRAAELDVQSAAAPIVPMSEIDQIAQPEISAETVETPSAETAPNLTEIDQTEPPDAADAEPDLSALQQPDQPDVVAVAPTVQEPDPHVQTPPDLARPPLDGNELNAPTVLNRPSPPRNAPRVDVTAAAKPPEAAQPAIEATPEVADGPAEAVVETPEEAAAPQEATTEITPEGQRDVEISAFAPRVAARAPRRPNRLSVATPAPQPDIADAVNAAVQQEQQQATQTTPPVVADLTGPEKSAIADVVSPMWNKGNIIGQENYEQYVVRITVEVSASGAIESVTPLEPANPSGLFDVAYQAARRAVFRAGEIPLPAGKFPTGVRLLLRFDPASGEIGFN